MSSNSSLSRPEARAFSALRSMTTSRGKRNSQVSYQAFVEPEIELLRVQAGQRRNVSPQVENIVASFSTVRFCLYLLVVPTLVMTGAVFLFFLARNPGMMLVLSPGVLLVPIVRYAMGYLERVFENRVVLAIANAAHGGTREALLENLGVAYDAIRLSPVFFKKFDLWVLDRGGTPQGDQPDPNTFEWLLWKLESAGQYALERFEPGALGSSKFGETDRIFDGIVQKVAERMPELKARWLGNSLTVADAFCCAMTANATLAAFSLFGFRGF